MKGAPPETGAFSFDCSTQTEQKNYSIDLSGTRMKEVMRVKKVAATLPSITSITAFGGSAQIG